MFPSSTDYEVAPESEEPQRTGPASLDDVVEAINNLRSTVQSLLALAVFILVVVPVLGAIIVAARH